MKQTNDVSLARRHPIITVHSMQTLFPKTGRLFAPACARDDVTIGCYRLLNFFRSLELTGAYHHSFSYLSVSHREAAHSGSISSFEYYATLQNLIAN